MTDPSADATLSTLTVEIAGEEWRRPSDACLHDGAVNVNTLLGLVPDAGGGVGRRDLRIRLRCGECGVPLRVDPDTARAPADGEPGVVIVVGPPADSNS